MNNSWYNIESGELHEEGEVKDDWKCHLCMYNSIKNKNIKMFKGIGNNRFKIFCHECAEMGGMVDYLLGDGTNEKVNAFIQRGCKNNLK